MDELLDLSLLDLCDRLHNRRVSPVELMEIVLASIDATRETLNSVVVVRDRERLLDEARTAEQRIVGGEGRKLDSGTVVPPDVEVGDVVIIAKYGGTEITVDGEDYLIMDTGQLLAKEA